MGRVAGDRRQAFCAREQPLGLLEQDDPGRSEGHLAAGAFEKLRTDLVFLRICTLSTFPALALTGHSFEIIGSAHNGPEYLAETLQIVARGDVKPMIEVFPKEAVDEAYQRLINGELRFKAVVTY